MIQLFGNRRRRRQKWEEDRAHRSWIMRNINKVPEEVANLTIDNMLYSKKYDKKFFIHHIPGILMYVRREQEESLGKEEGGWRWLSVRFIQQREREHVDSDRTFSFYCATEKYNQDIDVSGNIPVSMFDIGEDKDFTILKETRQEWHNSLQDLDSEQYMNLMNLNLDKES